MEMDLLHQVRMVILRELEDWIGTIAELWIWLKLLHCCDDVAYSFKYIILC